MKEQIYYSQKCVYLGISHIAVVMKAQGDFLLWSAHKLTGIHCAVLFNGYDAVFSGRIGIFN